MASTRLIRLRRTTAALAATVSLFAWAAAEDAPAAVTCDFDTITGVLTVDVTNGTPVAMLSKATPSGEIVVDDDSTVGNDPTVTCSGGTPTDTTTSSVVVDETTANQATSLGLDFAGGRLAPGTGDTETGLPEIELDYETDLVGIDALTVNAPAETGPQRFSFGPTAPTETGADLNDDDDADDISAVNLEHLLVAPGHGSDLIEGNGSGAASFTGPLTIETDVFASMGDDSFLGGNGNNAFFGGPGDDEMTGGSGTDSFDMGEQDDFGDDTYDGGGGTQDFASWEGEPSALGVTLDLSVTGPQDTLGFGTDQVMNAEHIVGSNGPDRLSGTAGPNVIFGGGIFDAGDDVLDGAAGADTLHGRPGNDTLIGGPGNDELNGEGGTDTASYASGSTSAVTLDLNIGLTDVPQATGGAGSDTLLDGFVDDGDHAMENIIGSPFGGDTLTGNDGINRIDVHDGLGDSVDCLAESDTLVADETGVDAASNCEIVDTAPQTSFGAGGPPNGATINDLTPTYSLTADEGSDFEYRVGTGAWIPCAAACEVGPLADGTAALSFRAVDQDEDGNADLTPVSRTVTVDATAPDTTVTGKVRTKLKKGKKRARVSFAVASEAGASLECSLDGSPFAACSSPFVAVVKRGSHTLRARATDSVGNTDASPASFTFRVTKKKRKKKK